MKKIILYMTLCLIGMVQVACDQDIDGFDNSTNYIYFDLPFQLDQYGRKTTERVDSLVYSFAMDDPSVTSYTFKIPVNSVGLKTETDRHYKVVVNEKKTTATGTDWDMSVIEKAVIQSGTLRDTLEVKVNRTPILKKESRTITLYIENNENFQVGASELLAAKLVFSDILQAPSWWPSWERYFGVFVREKYAKWQEIYFYGADPNVEKWGPNPGKLLYWVQMPYYAGYPSWYPSTFMFISKLKQYFIDHEVYPDGDTSKPRITLP